MKADQGFDEEIRKFRAREDRSQRQARQFDGRDRLVPLAAKDAGDIGGVIGFGAGDLIDGVAVRFAEERRGGSKGHVGAREIGNLALAAIDGERARFLRMGKGAREILGILIVAQEDIGSEAILARVRLLIKELDADKDLSSARKLELMAALVRRLVAKDQ